MVKHHCFLGLFKNILFSTDWRSLSNPKVWVDAAEQVFFTNIAFRRKNTQSPNCSLILLSNKFKGHKLINSKASLPSTFIPAPTGKLVGLSKEDIYGLPCL